MRSFRDESNTVEARLFGLQPQGQETVPAPAPDEIKYSPQLRAKYLVRAVKVLYPTEECGRTYFIQDDGDGNGPYFKVWSAEDGPPDDMRVMEVVMDLAKKDAAGGVINSKMLVQKAVRAVMDSVEDMVKTGKYQFSNNLYDFSVVDDIFLHLSYCNISKVPMSRKLAFYSLMTQSYEIGEYDINAVKDVYMVGAKLKLDLLSCRDKIIADIKRMNDKQLNEVVKAPRKFIDPTLMMQVKIGL